VKENLSQLEFEVEQARAKLANDLAVLRSPQTYREFALELKADAKSLAQRALDDLKARAAANPTAALAIGAGLGWRLIKHPPIATALVGAGVLGLWRTTPAPIDDDDYLNTAQRRLREQVGHAAETVKDYAAEKANAAQEKASAYATTARETVKEVASSAVEQATETLERAREAATDVSEKAVNVAQRATSQVGRTVADQGVRDQLLLGAAGLAVAAALGIAYQRRSGNGREAWD
jgi:DNA repair exonuclease SbcCD ATPase subunit